MRISPCTVASQLVSHDHTRHILQPCQQPPEEARGSSGSTPALNKDVEHNAVLIHGTPEIVLHALDPDEYLVEILGSDPLSKCREKR